MIIGEGKPIQEILSMIEPYSKIIIAGCRGCVTVCSAGGEKEVGILAAALDMARQKEGKPIEIKELAIERQCDPEYLEQVRGIIDEYEAVLSIACGADIQAPPRYQLSRLRLSHVSGLCHEAGRRQGIVGELLGCV